MKLLFPLIPAGLISLFEYTNTQTYPSPTHTVGSIMYLKNVKFQETTYGFCSLSQYISKNRSSTHTETQYLIIGYNPSSRTSFGVKVKFKQVLSQSAKRQFISTSSISFPCILRFSLTYAPICELSCTSLTILIFNSEECTVVERVQEFSK